VSCHRPPLPASPPLLPTAIPTVHDPRFSLQHFPYYVWFSQFSCSLHRIYWIFPCILFVFWHFLALPLIGHTAVVSARKLNSAELNWIGLLLFQLFCSLIYQYLCILVLHIRVFTHHLPFSSINSTPHNCTLYALNKTIVSQICLSEL